MRFCVFCLNLDDLFSSFFLSAKPDVLELGSSIAWYLACSGRQIPVRLEVIDCL